MSDTTTMRRLRRIVTQTGITYSTLASLAGVSVSTARMVLAAEQMPKRRSAHDALARFVAKNLDAKTREDLQLV